MMNLWMDALFYPKTGRLEKALQCTAKLPTAILAQSNRLSNAEIESMPGAL